MSRKKNIVKISADAISRMTPESSIFPVIDGRSLGASKWLPIIDATLSTLLDPSDPNYDVNACVKWPRFVSREEANACVASVQKATASEDNWRISAAVREEEGNAGWSVSFVKVKRKG